MLVWWLLLIGSVQVRGEVGVCPLSVVLRVPLMRLGLEVVYDPLVLFVILISGSNRSSSPPKGGPSTLRVYLRIVEVGIWFGFLWRSLLLVGF